MIVSEQKIFTVFLLLTSGCSQVERAWENPNDPDADPSFRRPEISKGAKPNEPERTRPNETVPELKKSLQPLIFNKFSLPILTENFDILEPTESNVLVAKSFFEQSVTFFSIERSKNLADYYWRLNARKYKLTETGFSPWSTDSVPVNLFPQCDDPSQGNGVSSVSITAISDKYRVPAYNQDSLPDNLTHVELTVQCRAASLGSSTATLSKIISLATLSEETSVRLTPLLTSYSIKCAWPKERVLVSKAGSLYNYRLWAGPNLPGNFSYSGSLALGEISECFENNDNLHIKTTSNKCYSFNMTANSLLSVSCIEGESFRKFRPFTVKHEAFASWDSYGSSNPVIYNLSTSNNEYKLTFKKPDSTSGSTVFEMRQNGIVQEQAASVIAGHEAGSSWGRVAVGFEQQFGQRIFGWSSDKKHIFLSSIVLSEQDITPLRNSDKPLDAEPAVPFAFKENIMSEGSSIYPNWNLELLANHLPAKFRILEPAVESSAWLPWSSNATYTVPAATQQGEVKLYMSDERGYSSPAFPIGKSSEYKWYQEAYIKAVNAGSGDSFGNSVSVSGNTLAVGAPGEDSNQTTITNIPTASGDNSAVNSGAVYVYRRNGVHWAQEAYIKAANAGASDSFGFSVSLSGDTLAVGAYLEDSNQTTITNGMFASSNNSCCDFGAAYVYRRSGVNWAQEAYIKAANPGGNDYFGESVSLSGDTLAVGAKYEDAGQSTITNGTAASSDNSLDSSGAVYVYRRSGVNWAQEAYIKASNPNIADYFGSSVSLSNDTLAVGAFGEDSSQTTITNGTGASSNNSGDKAGAVYVYRRSGLTWAQEAYIKAANNSYYYYGENFGISVSLSDDTLAVGATGEDSNQASITNGTGASSNNSASNSGAVYVYRRSGVNWAQEAYIKAVNVEVNDGFGQSVSLSGDFLAVGATGEDSTQTTITNGITASADNSALESGAVYVYRRTGVNWARDAYIKAANAEADDNFGYSISLSGDLLAVGATGEDSSQITITNGTGVATDNSASDSGAVYVYKKTREQSFESIQSTVSSTGQVSISWATDSEIAANINTYKVVYGTTIPNEHCTSGTQAYRGNQTSATFNYGPSEGAIIYVRICAGYDSNFLPGKVLPVVVDTTAPKIQNIRRGESLNPTSVNSVVNFIISFSEPVMGVSVSNFSVVDPNGIGGHGLVQKVDCDDDATQCTVFIKVLSTIGSLRLDFSNVGGVTDLRGVPILDTRVGDEAYKLGSGWYPEAYIKSANTSASDFFGHSISMSENILAVGAPYDSTSGAVYVYSRSESTWAQEAVITGTGTFSKFGHSISLSGNTLAVGAPNKDNVGAVYIYSRSGDIWIQTAIIYAGSVGTNDYFGYAVSLYGDTLAVGAYGEDSSYTSIVNGAGNVVNENAPNSGAVYIYRRSGSSWNKEAFIKSENSEVDDYFGHSVSLSENTLAVGAIGEDSAQSTITTGAGVENNAAPNAGAVYMYSRNNSWYRQAYIKAANSDQGDKFGYTVSLSGDLLVVGVPFEDSNQNTISQNSAANTDNSTPSAGAAYIFRRSSAAQWSQEAYVKAANTKANNKFGISAVIRDNLLIVGATGDGSLSNSVVHSGTANLDTSTSDFGAVHVFRHSSSGWNRESFLKPSNSDVNDGFGSSIALSDNTIAIGSPGEDSNENIITNGTSASSDNSAQDAGAVYVFRLLGDEKIIQPNYTVSGSVVNISWSTNSSELPVKIFKVVYGSNPPAFDCSDGTVAYEGEQPSTTFDFGGTSGTRVFIRICAGEGTSYYPGPIGSVYIDTVAPTISSIQGVSSNPTLTNDLVFFQINFSEPIKGLSQANLSLTDPTNQGGQGAIESIDCNFSNYCRIGVRIESISGNLRLDFINPAGVTDLIGNTVSGIYTNGKPYLIGKWYQEAYIKAANAEAQDYFGCSVSLSGDTLAVGATGEDSSETTITNGTGTSSSNSASEAGAVYVYRRIDDIWEQEAYIKAVNAGSGDAFGSSVSLSGDTLAVGATNEDSSETTITNGTGTSSGNSASGAGAVYVYRRIDDIWKQEAYIKAANAEANDRFGHSVSLSGNTLAVGAEKEASNQTTITNGTGASSNNNASFSGAVYVYRRSGVNWAQEAYIKAANAEAYDRFGQSVSVYGDTLAVGAPWEDSDSTEIINGNSVNQDNNRTNFGAVYVYRRYSSGWEQEAYIKPPSVSSRGFAEEVSLSSNMLVIANSLDSIGTYSSYSPLEGTVFTIRRTNASWSRWSGSRFNASTTESYDYFGSSVALGVDSLAIGAPGDDSSQQIITNGTPSSIDNSAQESGAVYIFRLNSSLNWIQEGYIKASNAESNDTFGWNIAISGDTLAVGVKNEASDQTTITNGNSASGVNTAANSGAVYVYRFKNRVHEPHIFISDKTSNSITLSWNKNLGTAQSVKIAPVSSYTATPSACTAFSSITLAANVTSYTYTGLSPNTKYGFRVCAFDGTNVSAGALIWEDTLP